MRGPLAALLLGRTSELDRGLVARYRRGGMYHLLVIAGLHVGLAAGLALVLLRALSVRGRVRNGVLLATVFLFVVVGGGNPPAARAGIVCGILFAARLLERPIHAAQAIALSALAPLRRLARAALQRSGTVLTFAAVSGIAAFTQPLRELLPARPEFIFSGLAAAVAAQIATSPILLWRFNVVSAGAWLTAPFSIPLAAGLIALGCLLLVLFAAGLAPGPLVALFAGGSRLLEWMAERASGVAFLRPTPPLAWIVAVMTLLACGVLASRRMRGCLFAAAAALFAFLALRGGPSGPARGFSLEALDVGQGDALLVRWRDRAVLVDGGGPFDRDARDFGRTHVLPKLLDRGVTSLDAVLLTHPHPDHALGLFTILDELPVGALWRSSGQDEGGMSADLEAAAIRRGVPIRVLSTGERVRWRDAMLAVLHSGGPLTKKDGINNQSVVARFERDGRSALLTGDAGAAAEAQISRIFPSMRIRSDILKVGHHGSRGSTSAAFLDAVAPRAALLSCGRENRFGHPAAETLASLSARECPPLSHGSRLRRRLRAPAGRDPACSGAVFDEEERPSRPARDPGADRVGQDRTSRTPWRSPAGEKSSRRTPSPCTAASMPAPPSRHAAQRAEVPYHLVDVATPFETYSAGRWAREARSIVEEIGRRGRLPIVCGGSGFYISALLDGLPPKGRGSIPRSAPL